MLPLKPLSSLALEQNRDTAALQRRWSDGGRSQTWSRQIAVERQPSDAITRPLSFLIKYYSNLLRFFLLPINPTDALHPSTTATFLRRQNLPLAQRFKGVKKNSGGFLLTICIFLCENNQRIIGCRKILNQSVPHAAALKPETAL